MGIRHFPRPARRPAGAEPYLLRQRKSTKVAPWALGIFVAGYGGWVAVSAVRDRYTVAAGLGFAGIVLLEFALLLSPILISAWRPARSPGHGLPPPGVLVEVDEGGIRLYGVLTGWPKVTEIDVYRKVFPLLDESGLIERHLVVVERTADGGPPPLRSQHPAEPWEWGSDVHLGDASVRLRDLAAAVHAHAPDVVVRDAGQIDCY